jgi:hypothetical protein
LMNFQKHWHAGTVLDPCSSAPWFAGWRAPPATGMGPHPVAVARTWLARIGWRRHGLIGADERPRVSRPGSGSGRSPAFTRAVVDLL